MKDYYIVYTQDGCSYCDRAIGTLREKKEPFMVSNVTHGVQRIDDALVSLALQYTVNLDPDGLDLAFS